MTKRIFIISLIALLIDEITKLLVSMFIETQNSITVIPGFFYLTNISNTGAAFSTLQNHTSFLIILSIISIILLLKMTKDFNNGLIKDISFGLLFGGIFGNLKDRLFLGAVRDFLKFDIFDYHAPIFNFADAFITIGIIMLLILSFKGGLDGNKSKK